MPWLWSYFIDCACDFNALCSLEPHHVVISGNLIGHSLVSDIMLENYSPSLSLQLKKNGIVTCFIAAVCLITVLRELRERGHVLCPGIFFHDVFC